MITIDYRDSQVSVAVLGEFTLADFKEFEELVQFKVKFEGPVNLLFDLTEMADFTVNMAWEEIKFSRAHGGDFQAHRRRHRQRVDCLERVAVAGLRRCRPARFP